MPKKQDEPESEPRQPLHSKELLLFNLRNLELISFELEREQVLRLSALSTEDKSTLRQNDIRFPAPPFNLSGEQIQKLKTIAGNRWEELEPLLPEFEHELLKYREARSRKDSGRTYSESRERLIRDTVCHMHAFIDGAIKLLHQDGRSRMSAIKRGFDEETIRNYSQTSAKLVVILYEQIENLPPIKGKGRRRDSRPVFFAMRIAEILEEGGITPSIARKSLHYKLLKELFVILNEGKEDPESIIRAAKKQRAEFKALGLNARMFTL